MNKFTIKSENKRYYFFWKGNGTIDDPRTYVCYFTNVRHATKVFIFLNKYHSEDIVSPTSLAAYIANRVNSDEKINVIFTI